MTTTSPNPLDDQFITAQEAMAITRHESLPAFYRWVRAHRNTRSRQGVYSRNAVLRAMRPKTQEGAR